MQSNDKKPGRYLQPIKTASVVQLVIDRLTQAILAGELRPGDKIPTEPELVAAFGIGRNSIREAIRYLEAYGVLEIRRPEGTFVCDGFSTKMINPMLYSVILQKEESYSELIELREMFESAIARMLMERALPLEALRPARTAYETLAVLVAAQPLDIGRVLAADIAFHEELAAATGNSLVVVIQEMISELTRISRENVITRMIEGGRSDELLYAHRIELEAIEHADRAEFEHSMQFNYSIWKDKGGN